MKILKMIADNNGVDVVGGEVISVQKNNNDVTFIVNTKNDSMEIKGNSLGMAMTQNDRRTIEVSIAAGDGVPTESMICDLSRQVADLIKGDIECQRMFGYSIYNIDTKIILIRLNEFLEECKRKTISRLLNNLNME